MDAKDIDFEVVAVPSFDEVDARPMAIACTGSEGCFIVFFAAFGFKYVDLSEGQWKEAMKFNGSITPGFGLFHYNQGDASWISFVESPAKSFVCYRISEESIVGRMTFPGDVMATCPAGEGIAAMVLSTGQLRFADLTTGKACGKGARPKFFDKEESKPFCMAQVKPRQVVVMRQVKAVNVFNVQFFVVELDEMNNAQIQQSGVLKMGSLARLSHGLGENFELDSIDAIGGEQDDKAGQPRIILACKRTAPIPTNGLLNGKQAEHSECSEQGRRFALANLHTLRAEALGAFSGASDESENSPHWHLMGLDYFVEWFVEDGVRFRLRDSKYGLIVGTGHVSRNGKLKNSESGKRDSLFLCTSERFSLASVEGSFVAIRWTLPRYHLASMLGRGAPADAPPFDLGEALSRKRKHEADDEIDSSFIASLVRNCQGEGHSDVQMLRSCLKPEDLPFVLKTLTAWLSFRRDLTAGSINAAAPGLPSVAAMARFLKALADAFVQSIVTLPADLVQKVIECLVAAQKDVACNEKLFSRAAAAYCEPVRKNTGAASHSRVDIAILDF